MELTYTTEKSEKEMVELMFRRGSCDIGTASLWFPLWFCCTAVSATCLTWVLSISLVDFGMALVHLCLLGCYLLVAYGIVLIQRFFHRRAYRRQKSHLVEYKLTDEGLTVTGGANTIISAPWRKVAKRYMFGKTALFLYGLYGWTQLPFEMKVIPDWEGRGVRRAELETALRKAGLKRRGLGKFERPILAMSYVMLAVCSLGSSISVGEPLWLRVEAARGDAQAQFRFGEFASDVGRIKGEAIKWWRKAAEQGCAPAQFELGELYAGGVCVERDIPESVKWFRKAAEQGHAPAQRQLGFCYEHGIVVEKDEAEAQKWRDRAAAQGRENQD